MMTNHSFSDSLLLLAQAEGFETAVPLKPSRLILRDEVRGMCRTGSCGRYGKNWACPPACGTLEQCRKDIQRFSDGILVQTIGDIEDSFDVEGIMEAEKLHKERFERLIGQIPEHTASFPLGVGCCTICKECTYPDHPCRFPERRISSMEAYGLLVNDVCTALGVKYYYGPNHITYTSCILF